MSIREVLTDNRTARKAFPASIGVANGDLMWWDAANKVVRPAALRTDQGSLAANQIDFAAIFAGVSLDQRLSTETSVTPQSDRIIALHGIFDASCATATWVEGDLVGIDRSATPANYNQQVIKVTSPALAFGMCVVGGANLTTVRCQLTSSLFFSDWSKFGLALFGAQGTSSTTLSDTSQTLTLSTNPVLNMVPTAGRNVTLPSEALAQLAGLAYLFTNNSAGANSVTFLGSAGGAVKGNGVCPQNKTCLLWTDGTSWNGLVSA